VASDCLPFETDSTRRDKGQFERLDASVVIYTATIPNALTEAEKPIIEHMKGDRHAK
jgi:hypothetical protein